MPSPLKPYLFTVLLFIQATINAQEMDSIDIPKVSGEITIDANLNEPQWQQAKRILINNITRPYDNIPSPVHTEALLMESSGVFYLAFIAHDPDPSQIKAFLKDRDKSWGDDIVGIKIDSYNDQRTAYRFLVNPLGVQTDGIESEITKKESDAWDGIWQSSGKITSEGYIVEMALPLSMLNFNDKLDVQHWGIELMRFYPRSEMLRLSNIKIDRGNSCEICQLATATGFSGAKQGNNLIVTPAVVASSSEFRDDSEPWEKDNNVEASLDIRWGITPDLLLNATINPDFSTVETDRAQLNINNTFALFNQEKRPFFLDNADYFDSNYNLVYTRNINAPNYGAKLTGRHNDHSFGVFLTDDSSTHILIPGNRGSSVAEIEGESKAAVVRYRNNFNNDITLGWVSTLRSATDYQNSVHGIDARFRLSTEDVVKFQSLYSITEYPSDLFEQFCNADDPQDCTKPADNTECDLNDCDYNEQVLRTLKDGQFDGNAFKAGYYHNDSHWSYNATFDKQNSDFRADLGFIPRVDYQKTGISGNRKWYAEPGNWWNQAKVYSGWNITKNDNGELIKKQFDINFQLNASYESYLRVSYTNRDKVGSRIDKSSLAINGNTTMFTENQYHLYGNIKPLLGLMVSASMKVGDTIDYSSNRLGKIKQFSPTINWNINRHLEVKLRQTFRQLNADNAEGINDTVFTARLTDLRTTYQFNVMSFLRFSLIYNNTYRNPYNYLYESPEDITPHSKSFSSEVLYGYKINPQTVFYLGYSDSHYTEDNFTDLSQNQRNIFMKFSYAWIK